MIYTELKVANETYKLRLNTQNLIGLEKELGCNPLGIFGDGTTIPTVEQMVNILYYSALQLNHGFTKANAYEVFDNYLSEGNLITDFLTVILEIYKSSGLIAQDLDESAVKNA